MKINFAILGLGKIADRIAIGIINSNYASIYAVGSRDINKANNFKDKYKAIKAYGNYEDLFNDEKVDVIFIATINQTHYDLIKKALYHHKNVICEKPMVPTQKEVKELFTYAKKQNCFLMEAQKLIFTPLNTKIKKMIEDGVIGDIKLIDASYRYNGNFDINHWVMTKEYGGSFRDVGSYPMSYGNFMINEEIKDIVILDNKKENDVEVESSILVRYHNNIHAYYRSSIVSKDDNRAIIFGTKAVIVTANFWKNNVAYLFKDEAWQKIEVKQLSDFSGEIDHVCECIKNKLLQSPIYGEKESSSIAKVFDLLNY